MDNTVRKLYLEEHKKPDIIQLPVLHLKADGTVDGRYGKKPNRKKYEGVHISTMMKCLYDKDEIIAVYNIFKERVVNASSIKKEYNARRNLCMFVSGINIGLRGSDLCSIKWANIFNSSWNFIDRPIFMPQKTSNHNVTVELTWSHDFEVEILRFLHWKNKYIKEQELQDYIFSSQKNEHVGAKRWWEIMEKTRKEAGIKQKIGTHGLRKTMVHNYIETAEDRYDA